MPVDESTHVVNLAQWPVLVWYCYVGAILEEILFCESLVGRTTGEDIFHLINKFFEMMVFCGRTM
jgi:hypothetical protein